MDTARWTKDECADFEDVAVRGKIMQMQGWWEALFKFQDSSGYISHNSICRALAQCAIDVYACHPARHLGDKSRATGCNARKKEPDMIPWGDRRR